MANIVLGSVSGKDATIVSNRFIDEYMSSANGEFVKIYLYLLRCMNSPEESISISKIADKFDHTEKDVKRALKYWEKANLLRLEFDTEGHLTGIYLIDSINNTAASDSRPDLVSLRRGYPLTAPEKKAPTKVRYSADDLTRFQNEESVQELLFVTEHYFGRSLTRTEMDTILYWYDALHFDTELIEYLIEYCTENGHKSVRYMDKVALTWKENNIVSAKQAKKEVRSHSRTYCAVRKAFGISGRGLAENETVLLEKWIKEYRFSDELITEACKRTMQAIHQPSFEYTDSILANWREHHVSSTADVAALDNAFQKSRAAVSKTRSHQATNKFNNFTPRTYNYDQLEQQLLKSTK